MRGDVTAPWLCVWVTLVVTAVNGSAITFTTTSTSIKPLISTNLTLRCSLVDTSPSQSLSEPPRVIQHKNTGENCKNLTKTTNDVDFVTAIVIARNGVDIAVVSEHVPARALVQSPGLNVTGNLPGKPGERGFLELTWELPTSRESGAYQCNIDSIDLKGHSYDFSQTFEVKENKDVSFSDLVTYVIDMQRDKKYMKQTIETQAETIAELKAIQKDISATDTLVEIQEYMNRTIISQNQEIASLQQTCNQLETAINQTRPEVFFSAALNSSSSFSTNQVFVFNHVYANMGGAYQAETGVFTCPQGGYYYFAMTVQTQGSKSAYFKLQLNNADVIETFSQSSNGYQSASNSAILKLHQGDTVRVVSQGSSYIYSNKPHPSTTFSGHLISSV